MVIIVVGREFAVTGLRSIASAEGVTISASRLGKYKMISQVACCSCLIAASRYPESVLLQIGGMLLWLVVLLAIASMIHYFQTFWGQIGESARSRREERKRKKLEMVGNESKSNDALINT
jgi:CDP-diacylglycerol--glycerol-3-phosphate 3-phosphatidyltransferase